MVEEWRAGGIESGGLGDARGRDLYIGRGVLLFSAYKD